MQVGEIMKKEVRACGPGDNLAEAANLMWEQDCGVLPVLEEDGRLAGILTDRDVCIALGTRNRRASEVAVKEVATRDVKTCAPDTDIEAAMLLMRKAKVRRLPVLDDGRLAGIVTLNDLVMAATAKRGPIFYDDVIETLQAVSMPWKSPVPGKDGEPEIEQSAEIHPPIPVAVA